MVEQSASLDLVFHALSSDARRFILDRLKLGDLAVTEIAAPLALTLAAVSKHVRVLTAAGLVVQRTEGRRHVCSLVSGGLESARRWLDAAPSDERLIGGRTSGRAEFDEEID